jgi:hypothetical protein
MSQKRAVFLPVLALLSACTTMPIGPNVMVLSGAGKPFDQFQVDDVLCRQFAEQQVGGIPGGQASTQDTLSSAAIGAVVGASGCWGRRGGRHRTSYGYRGRLRVRSELSEGAAMAL